MFPRVALLGVGYIGGSAVLAARQAGLVGRVVGYDVSAAAGVSGQQKGVLDATAGALAEAVRDATLVLLAAPVRSLETILHQLATVLPVDATVIDVGSVKADVVAAAETALPSGQFVGCHPMAGSEKTGYNHSSDTLYENASVIVTPHGMNRPGDVERIVQFWKLLGARTAVTTPELHDRIVAMTSHLPHVVAGALAEPEEPTDAEPWPADDDASDRVATRATLQHYLRTGTRKESA